MSFVNRRKTFLFTRDGPICELAPCSRRVPRGALCLGSVCIEDLQRTQHLQLYFLKRKQILECLDWDELRGGCSGHGLDSGANAAPTFLTPYRVFLCVCVCVLNLSCIMQKCVFLNFFHSGHENYAFLTCFLISVAIFLIQVISMDREFTQQIALGLDLVVNLDPVLP